MYQINPHKKKMTILEPNYPTQRALETNKSQIRSTHMRDICWTERDERLIEQPKLQQTELEAVRQRPHERCEEMKKQRKKQEK